MTKHYILQLDPAAKYEWDRCALRDPITADRPAFAEIIAEAVGDQPGSYLVAVNIEVQVLEKAAPQAPVASPVPSGTSTATPLSELPPRTALPQLQGLVA
jgi:hypothetical protein